MSEPLLLLPNVGAEETPWAEAMPGGAESSPAQAVRAAVAQLWLPLFAAGTRWLDPGEWADPGYPQALGEPPGPPVFGWLDRPGALTAWLNTEAAARAAEAAGRPLTGAPPAVVRRVHDKAFAHAAACAEGWMPAELARTIAVLEPRELADPDAGGRRVQAVLDAWPEWARRSFTLKPRFGCSGRGRVAGVDGRADAPALRRALPRLAARGGALLEPWCDRREDLSASLFVASGGELLLLGTTRQWLAPSGRYLGQRGTVDSKGRINSGSAFDEAVREAAASIARAAAACGFHGPCGVDAFVYRSPAGGDALRPVVELNARFSMGTLAIGWLRRSLRHLRRRFRPPPERRLHFHFGLDAPPGGWPAASDSLLVIALPRAAGGPRPALVVATAADELAHSLDGAGAQA